MRFPTFILFLFFAVLLPGTLVSAQEPVPNRRAKAIYADLLGNNISSGPSLNFDMRFKRSTNIGFGAKIGFGTKAEKRGQYYRRYHIPLGIYYTQGSERFMLESGLGLTGFRTDRPYQINSNTGARGEFIEKTYDAVFFLNLGLRAQAKKTGGIFRFYWAPILVLNESPSILNFGVSAGLGFK